MKNLKTKKMKLSGCVLAFLSIFSFNVGKAQFTQGNLVVLQVNDGVATFTNTGNAIILREFSPLGTPGFSLNVPTTGTNALVVSGSATSEGALSLSSNNKYLVFGGYSASTSNTISLASSTIIPRAVSVVDAAGNYSLIALSATFHLGNNIRSATSDGSNNYWSAGGNDGTDYFGTASATTNIQNGITNTRCVNIFTNNLYFSTGSGTKGVYKIGSGLPVTSGQTNTIVIDETVTGSGTPSPYAFFFNAAQSVCYVADDRSISTGGGIQKWVNSSSTWTLAYTLGTGSSSTVGARGVVVDFSGSTPMVYATTAESTNNRIIAIADAGSTSAATTIATSTTNAIFRGIAFSPCNIPSISSVTGGTICAGQTLSLTVNASSTSSLTYAWAGSGTISAATSSNASVSGASSGNYSVTVFNDCGSASSTVAVTVNAAPSLSVSGTSASVCPGQTVALTASGANTYTWSNGLSNGSMFTATSSAVYTVTGAVNNCTATSTIAVTVNPLPALNAGSVTVCSGQSTTITASGANTYTWSNGSNASSLVITPTTNTSYVVSGTSSLNCSVTLTVPVVVTSSPAVNVNSSTVCAGTSATLIAGGATTFTWSTGATAGSIIVTPATNTVYSVSGSLAGCAGISSNTAAVTVNPLPTLSISGASLVCTGSSITQTLGGAIIYSMNSNTISPVITLTPGATTSYTFMGSSAVGCTGSISKTITVAPLPTLSISGATAVCSGASLSQTISGATSYSLNGNTTSPVLTMTPASTTSYTIAGTDANGCLANANETITVKALPTLTLNSNMPQICSGSSATISVTGAATYSWMNSLGTSTSIVVNPSLTTSYSVTGTNSLGCSATAQITQSVSLCTSVNSISKNEFQYTLYPNPARQFVTLDNLQGSGEIRIVNALGTVVLKDSFENGSRTIDVSGLSKGIYFISISSSGKAPMKKLIVE